MLLFGDIVVVEKNLIGVIVKTWEDLYGEVTYDVYVRNYNRVVSYKSDKVARFNVRHKELGQYDYIAQKIGQKQGGNK